MKILITGGCGFIGNNLVEYLTEKGFTVRIIDNLSVGNKESLKNLSLSQSQELIIGDIRDEKAIERAIEGTDAVVHLAAHTSVVESLEKPQESWDINVNGTLNLLESCRRNGINRFILASSNAVAGEQEPPIDEEMIPRPLSPYGASKLADEALCSSYYHSFGLNTVSLRFANCYGPYSIHKTSVISKFFKLIQEGKPLIIYGDGSQTRDFIYVEDICRAIGLSLLADDSISGEVFQIASGVETTILKLAELIGGITGNRVQINYEPERPGEIKRNYSDISKAKKVLGFEPGVELEEGLSRLWNSLKS